MSTFSLRVGDFIRIERLDSGRQFTAVVDHITKGRRVQFKYPNDGSNKWTKARTVDERNEKILGLATQHEAAALMRQMEGGA